MNREAKAIQAEYTRKWRAANKDKVKEYNRRYWEKKATERKKAMEGGDGNAKDKPVSA